MIDLQNSAYFNSLPPHIKESIMQSSVEFSSEEELREFADNVRKHKK